MTSRFFYAVFTGASGYGLAMTISTGRFAAAWTFAIILALCVATAYIFDKEDRYMRRLERKALFAKEEQIRHLTVMLESARKRVRRYEN